MAGSFLSAGIGQHFLPFWQKRVNPGNKRSKRLLDGLYAILPPTSKPLFLHTATRRSCRPDKILHRMMDTISYRSDKKPFFLVAAQSIGGIWKRPMDLLAYSRKNRTTIRLGGITNGYHVMKAPSSEKKIENSFGFLTRNVYSHLCHNFYRHRKNLLPCFKPSALHVEEIAAKMPQESLRHLTPGRIPTTEEQHLDLIHSHTAPPILGKFSSFKHKSLSSVQQFGYNKKTQDPGLHPDQSPPILGSCGGLAERSMAADLKSADAQASGGSNPSSSANNIQNPAEFT